MSKRVIRLTTLTVAYLGLGYLLKQHDPFHYTHITAKLREWNDSMRNVHQHVRMRELYANAHGEVVELNAGAGNTLPLLPSTISRYYANVTNPALLPKLKAATYEYGLPISHVELSSSLELLRAMGSDTMDTVILNGALRFERPGANQRLFNEIHRVLRPGGSVLFTEDIVHRNQIAPFQQVRRMVRNLFTQEHQSDFVVPMLKSFDCAYVEDWSRPPLGYHESHRQTTQRVLEYHQRHNAEENLGEYQRMVPKWDFSFLHRPLYGGWAVKKTTAQGDSELIRGNVSIDKLAAFTQQLVLGKQNNVQEKREKRAQREGYQFDLKFKQALRTSFERQQKKKPTPQKTSYPELQHIPVTVGSLFFGV